MRKLFLCTLLLTVSAIAFSQRFGGFSPSVKWKQVNTDTVRVIFPGGLNLDQQAMDIVTTAHRLAATTHSTLGDRLKKITIVLQPKTTVTNGYVGLGPRRSEFYLTPRQNSFELGSLPWHTFLASHEYRHVQQYNNFNKGISKAFYILFGEDGLSLATAAAVPNWFWEGDAVYQETVISEQGRGRLPFFFNDYRSLWQAKKNYSWMKLRNGSLKDYVPDHYRLGYILVAYGREKYGNDFWQKVTDDAARYKGLFYPFQEAVKKYAGTSFKNFRNDAFEYFKSTLPVDAGEPVAQWSQQQKHFTGDEEFPHWTGSDSVVLVKSSYKRIPAFYMRDITSGNERKLRVKDISLDNYFSYKNGRIVYAAYTPDTRWAWTDYSDLRLLDVASGMQTTITRHTNYFSPDISENGEQVVAVQVQPGTAAELHILNTNGKVLQKVPNTGNYFYTYPKFYRENKIVSAIRNADGAMTLGLVEPGNGHVEALVPWSMHVIGFPQVQGDTITFTASLNGRDELFAWVNGQLYKYNTGAVNTATGNYQFSIKNNKAVWTSFTAAGFHLVSQPASPTAWQTISDEQFAGSLFAYNLSDLQPGKAIPAGTSATYPVDNYHKAFRLFNFHSWRPYVSDPDYTYSLLGENVLNTMLSEIYFNYNNNEKYKQVGAALLYGGWFPYLTASVSGTFDRKVIDTPYNITWNEVNAGLGLRVPLNLGGGRYYRNMTLAGTINTRQVNYTGLSKNDFTNKQFNFVDLSFSYSQQSQVARQHIYPRLAYSLFTRYRQIINQYTANQFLANNTLYLPGVGLTHNLVVNAAWQLRDTMQQYSFSNSFPFSRGYTEVNAPRMWKVGVNYHFPLVYPDWGFGNILYFLRVRANAFYDHTDIMSLRTGQHFQFRSAGGEIYFDTKWWNEYEVTFGFRYSRLQDGELLGLAPNQWEFILPVNLLQR